LPTDHLQRNSCTAKRPIIVLKCAPLETVREFWDIRYFNKSEGYTFRRLILAKLSGCAGSSTNLPLIHVHNVVLRLARELGERESCQPPSTQALHSFKILGLTRMVLLAPRLLSSKSHLISEIRSPKFLRTISWHSKRKTHKICRESYGNDFLQRCESDQLNPLPSGPRFNQDFVTHNTYPTLLKPSGDFSIGFTRQNFSCRSTILCLPMVAK
jgi:hypothetical protein